MWVHGKTEAENLGKGQAGVVYQFSQGFRPVVSRILTWYLKMGFEECLHTYVCMYILEIGDDLFVNAQLCVCVCVPFNCREWSVRVRGEGRGEMWRERVKSCLVKRWRRCQGAKTERGW